MADPFSLAVGTLGATAAGGILGAIGSTTSGDAQQQMYQYQAGVARMNAQLAKQDANYSLAAGEVEAEQSGMRTRAEIGATRAGFGAGNVAGGSTNRVIQSETEIGQQNQGIIRANAAKRAYGFNVSSAADTAQAGAFTTAGQYAQEGGELGATQSIIGAAGSVSSKWLQMGQEFGPSGNPNAWSGYNVTGLGGP